MVQLADIDVCRCIANGIFDPAVFILADIEPKLRTVDIGIKGELRMPAEIEISSLINNLQDKGLLDHTVTATLNKSGTTVGLVESYWSRT